MFNRFDETRLNGTTSNPFDLLSDTTNSTDPFGLVENSSPNRLDDRPVVRARSGKDALSSTNWLAYQHSMDEANFDSADELHEPVNLVRSRNPFDLSDEIRSSETLFDTQPVNNTADPELTRSFYDFFGFNLSETSTNPFEIPSTTDQVDLFAPSSTEVQSKTKLTEIESDEDDSKMTFVIREKDVSSSNDNASLPIPHLPPPPSTSHSGEKSTRSSTSSSSDPDDNDPLSIFRSKPLNPPTTTTLTSISHSPQRSLITDWDEEQVPVEAKVIAWSMFVLLLFCSVSK